MGFGADGDGEAGKTACFSKAGLAEGTNAGTIKTAAPNGAGIDYAIHGIAYHKADTDNIAFTASAAVPISSSVLYTVQINAAGTVSMVRGVQALTANLGTQAILDWPAPLKDNCAIGGIRVTTDGSTTFTGGTTDLGAAGITDTYYDFAGGMPLRPLVA